MFVTPFALTLAALLAQDASGSEVKIEEQLLSPLGQGFTYVSSPGPADLATVGPAGSRMAVYKDGERGPKFDQIVTTNPTPEGGGVAVVFSPDGKRMAYVGRKRGEFKLIVDGEEMASGVIDQQYNTIAGLGFTPDSQHVYYRVRQMGEDGKAPWHFVMDGVASPAMGGNQMQVLVSPTGGGYVVIGTLMETGQQVFVRDGKVVESKASRFLYRHDGKLYTVENNQETGEQIFALDGEELYRGKFQINEIRTAPTGDSWALIGTNYEKGNGPHLVVNGEEIDGQLCNIGVGDTFLFSDDGSRWAAVMEPQTGRQYVIADGEEYDEYAAIHELAFSPDSRHLTFWGRSPAGAYFVINGEEQDGVSGITPAAVYGGEHVGWVEVGGQPAQYSALRDGERYVGNHNLYHSTLAMSPDGSRMAFMQQNTVIELTDEGAKAYEAVTVVASGRDNRGIYRPLPNGFMFSPDGKHLVYFGNNRQAGTKGIFFDDKQVIQDAGAMVSRIGFSPDGTHFYAVIGSANGMTLYVDGEPAMRFASTPFDSEKSMWHIDDDGVLRFVTADNDGIKRVTVTPSPDRTVADMVG